MASTYSSLKIELIGTGEQSGTWGDTTNINLGTAIEQAITGSGDVPFSSADVTLTLSNSNASQTARNLRLNLTGTSGGARNLIVPDIEKYYIIANGLANDVTVKNTTGTTYIIPAGTTAQVFSTGTGIKDAISFFAGSLLSSGAVILGGSINGTSIGAISASSGVFTTLNASGTVTFSSALSAANGGTGLSSPGTAGNILTSNGSSWVSSAAFSMVYPGAGIAVSTGSAWTTSLTAPSGTIVGTTDTQTLTNKRVTTRSLAPVNTTGTVTPNSDLYDQVNYLLTGTATFAVPSGTPTNGQKLNIRLYAASTQTVSWTTTSTGYRQIGTTLPLSVAAGKTVYVGCVWNSTDSFWDVVAVATQA